MGGFFKDVFSNFFGFIFFILGIAAIGFAFVSCALGGLFGGGTASWIPFVVFFVIGLILMAVSRAFAKRG